MVMWVVRMLYKLAYVSIRLCVVIIMEVIRIDEFIVYVFEFKFKKNSVITEICYVKD